MNQTQVNNFLSCLLQIDDRNYLALHARAAAISGSNPHTDDNHDHDHDHDHIHDHDESRAARDNGELLIAKVTAMVVLCCASTLCGCVPFLLNRYFRWTDQQANARSATVVKCLLYFGGGVLLCTTFLHLLPEVQETIEQLQECGVLPELSFSLAPLLMCGGFFLMYFIEELLHTCIHRHRKLIEEDAAAAFERGQSIRNSYLVRGNKIKPVEASAIKDELPEPSAPGKSSSATTLSLSVQHLVVHDAEHEKYQSIEVDKPQPHSHSHAHSYAHNYNHGHGHGHSLTHIDPAVEHDMIASSLRGFFIVLALSLHELFEGMAIGLENNVSDVWFMFGAVSAHKLVLAFCVGVELIVARTRTGLCIVYVLTFAIVSPLGIGIGILISGSQETTTPSISAAILQGLACGTLLYVVFFEILSKNHAGLIAYLALFVGFVVMFGLQQLGAEGHSHGSCSDRGHSHVHGANDDHTPHYYQHSAANAIATTKTTITNIADAHEHGPSDNFVRELQILRQASEKLIHAQKEHYHNNE